MSNPKSRCEEYWDLAVSADAIGRPGALEDLMEALMRDGDLEAAIQVGHEWLSQINDGVASTQFMHAAFSVAVALSKAERYDDSIEVVGRALDLPDFDCVDFERGLLHWHQASNRGSQDDQLGQLNELEASATYFSGDEGPRGAVLLEVGRLQQRLELYDAACLTLAESTILLEEAGEADDVAKAKFLHAEVLLAQGHLRMASQLADDSFRITSFLSRNRGVMECRLLRARIRSACQDDVSITEFESLMRETSTDESRQVAAKAYFYLAQHFSQCGNQSRSAELYGQAGPILRALGQSNLADQIPVF